MTYSLIDPLEDARWKAFLLRSENASVFHTRGWLLALRQTYRYGVTALTTNDITQELNNAFVYCKVNSWITGRRLVSLPFSDHCDILTESTISASDIMTQVHKSISQSTLKYAELRLRQEPFPNYKAVLPSQRYCLHVLSLDSSLDTLYRNLHKDCIQRKVRRAEREGLEYETGASDSLLRTFYDLMVRTRRRHGLPPQPLKWFKTLVSCLGEHMAIRVAKKDGIPVAAIVTLTFKDTMTYKYGCSDDRFSQLGGTPFLFWQAIQEAKNQGLRRLDLGRSELDNPGLITFKDRLGATRSDLKYYRFPCTPASRTHTALRTTRFLKRLLPYLPDNLLIAAGRVLYRHVG